MSNEMLTITCARCQARKHVSAYATFANPRDWSTQTGRRLAVVRDDHCRRCRSEMYRGVPDEVIKWREKEARLMKQLTKVREKIRALTAVSGPQGAA